MSTSHPLPGLSQPVIAMIHVGALPGTPASVLPLPEIIAQAVREAALYRDAGVHALMMENMHDTPYQRGGVGPEIVAAMTAIALAVKSAAALPCGLQILAGANREALAVALTAGLDFIRAEGYVFAHVADEGIMESCAADLLRYRRQIGAERIRIWADIKKKHSAHALTSDVSLAETAHAVEFMRGDAVIVTGSVTGDAPPQSEVIEAKRRVAIPVMVGSGVTAENLSSFHAVADGFIVGSTFKANGQWQQPPDRDRVLRFMEAYARRSDGAVT